MIWNLRPDAEDGGANDVGANETRHEAQQVGMADQIQELVAAAAHGDDAVHRPRHGAPQRLALGMDQRQPLVKRRATEGLLLGHAATGDLGVAGLVHDLLVEDCDILAFHSSQGGTILGTLCFIKSLLVLLGMRVELLSTWPLDERLKHLVDPGVADFAVVTETSLLEMSDEGAGGEVVTADGPLLIGKHEYHGIPGVLILKEPAACTGIVEDGRFYLLEGVMVDRAVFNQDSLTCPYVRHINPF